MPAADGRFPIAAVEIIERQRVEIDIVEAAHIDVDLVGIRAQHIERMDAAMAAESMFATPVLKV